MVNSQIKKPKILVGFSEIAGYYVNLFVGLAQLGNEVGYINNRYFKFQYNEYKKYNHPFLNYYIEVCRKFRVENSFFSKLLCALLTPVVIGWIIFKYDAFILGSDSTLLKYWDYKLLKFFKKKVIYVSLGSDTRPHYLSGIYKDDTKGGVFDINETIRLTKETKLKVEFFEKYSDVFINYPQHAHFNTKPFINGMCIGFPSRVEHNILGERIINDSLPLRILHSPSRPKVKGSVEFSALIEELKKEGLKIDFINITNKANTEVIQEILRADFVLDEFYSDIPLGGLGSEAAALGKLTISSGYYSEFCNSGDAKCKIPPSFYLYPDPFLIKEVIRDLYYNRNKIVEIGLELRKFIDEQWNCKTVALKYLEIIDGSIDQGYFVRPNELEYVYGVGLSKDELRRNLIELSKKGFESFQLDHNPRLIEIIKKIIE